MLFFPIHMFDCTDYNQLSWDKNTFFLLFLIKLLVTAIWKLTFTDKRTLLSKQTHENKRTFRFCLVRQELKWWGQFGDCSLLIVFLFLNFVSLWHQNTAMSLSLWKEDNMHRTIYSKLIYTDSAKPYTLKYPQMRSLH